MRIQFQILMFAILFNIAIYFIAATGFFPYTIAGDAFTYDVDDPEYDINDPEKLPSPDQIFTRLITNSVTGELAHIDIATYRIYLSFGVLMAGIVGLSVAVGIATKSMVPIGLMLVGLIFTVMWSNSQRVISSLTSGLDSSVNYIILMFLVAMLISFIILIYDSSARMS